MRTQHERRPYDTAERVVQVRGTLKPPAIAVWNRDETRIETGKVTLDLSRAEGGSTTCVDQWNRRARRLRTLSSFATHSLGDFRISCSQILSTDQPLRLSVRVMRASRSAFPLIFVRQYPELLLGVFLRQTGHDLTP